jgi:SNF2 family DNA or RNA helicase
VARVNREEKRKKNREEKRKAYRLRRLRILRQRKAEEFSWLAMQAFDRKDYATSLNWALKGITIDPSDGSLMDMAIQCAELLNDESTLYVLLRQSWEQRNLWGGAGHLRLGKLAFQRKDFKLATKIFQKLVAGPKTAAWRLPKTQLKEVEGYLASCQRMQQPAQTRVEFAARQPEDSAEPAPLSFPDGRSQAEKAISLAPEDSLELRVSFELNDKPILEAIKATRKADQNTFDLALQAYKLSFRGSYDQLLCLSTLRNVQSLWYQEETARKVMKTFRGRAILADEVGLGKTIEAGFVLKEYLLRGLARSVLIIVPSSLVSQWQEEMQEKFNLPFVSSNDALFREEPERFWAEPFILVSLQTARTKKHLEALTSRTYDLVVVDEAHHLKNRTTRNWKLVNAVQKTFLLLLTATPVQNKLEELYNLVTLLRPGHLKTLKAFKEEFITRGNPTDPRNREKLRQLLKEVMIRNTRSFTQLHLPPRFAFTTRVSPKPAESDFYQKVSEFVTEQAHLPSTHIPKMTLRRLLEAAGSSHIAALRMLEKIAVQSTDGIQDGAKEILAMGEAIQMGSKSQKVIEILQASPDQKIIFVNYLATLEYLKRLLEEHNLPHTVFQGNLTSSEKQAAMNSFKDGCPILLTTGIGGEGYNLQFCHMMINYDLPWNPMQIEQRIGRIHRIGQEKEVQVYNFCAAGSLEDHILDVLDRKINMFELVVGEIEMILGRIEGEQEFSDRVYEIWVRNADESQRKKAFDSLGSLLNRARAAYEKSKELDEKLFHEDFGV